MHYPTPIVKSISSSSLSLNVTPVRNTISSPIPKFSTEEIKVKHKLNKADLEYPLPLNQSTSFIATNFELPVVDISSVDYVAYRHKLIEALLKKHYNGQQAPGDVVLNTICLSSTDSKTEKKLRNKRGYNLFDIKDSSEPGKVIKKRELEYLHPLDYFLVKDFRIPETSEKATETKESITEIDDVPELVDFKDQQQSMILKRPLSIHSRRQGTFRDNKGSKATLGSKQRSIVSVADVINKNTNLSNKNIINKNETQQLYRRSEVPMVDVRLDSNSPRSQV